MVYKEVTFNRGYYEAENIINIVREFGGVIAGGYARWCASPLEEPAKPTDIDIFTNSDKQFNELKTEFLNRGFGIRYETESAITYASRRGGFSAQLIKPKTFSTTEELLDTIDFTVCKAAIDVHKKRIIVHEAFEADETAKRLVFTTIIYPAQALMRMSKYINYGYSISPKESFKILEAWDKASAELKEKSAKFIANVPEDGYQQGLGNRRLRIFENVAVAVQRVQPMQFFALEDLEPEAEVDRIEEA